MGTFLTVVLVVIAVALLIAFLNRFYRKASRERALIRTGWGGQRVMLDGGFLALPFLHRVEEIDMRTMHIPVERSGAESLMTEDRLRLDVAVAFYLRVQPSVEGVATAAQALGARALAPRELADLFSGRFVDAIQAVAASRTMDELHEDRSSFVAAVTDRLAGGLSQNGLKLESVSLTALDQASFSALDENNVFNAVGMRRLAEIVATNKLKRAEIEADAEVSVRQTELDGFKRKLELDREQQQAQIGQTLTIEKLRSDAGAETEHARQDAARRTEQARIARERDVQAAEIDRDRELREREVAALLAAESAKIDSQVQLAAKRMEETAAAAAAELARKDIVVAEETVHAERERLAAERELETALIRSRQTTQTLEEQARSEVRTLLERVQAQSQASGLEAEANRIALMAEADGKAALIKAENTLSEHVLRMKVDMHKLDRLPEIAERMMKPMEKIDSIRINQISGLGGGTRAGGSGGGSAMGEAVDGVLNLAFQLPAMQKLGQSLGMNLALGEDAPAGEPGAEAEQPEAK